MSRQLPPLHLIRIFEAAARQLSFKKAAEELCLTPSAISHQIKTLERHIDLKLFHRLSRGVALTPAGSAYLHTVEDVMQRLDRGTRALKAKYANPVLRISTFPTLAINMIIPRLNLFQQAHPDIEIRIETALNLVDFSYDEHDLAIRVGNGDWRGLHCQKLFDLAITPVCSADFAKTHQLQRIEQIADLPVINLPDMGDIWTTWLKAVGYDQVEPKSKLSFSSYDAALIAAQEGLGLGLGAIPLDSTLIRRGLLVTPFEKSMPFAQSVYAACRQEDKDRHDIQCFINWLINSPELIDLDMN